MGEPEKGREDVVSNLDIHHLYQLTKRAVQNRQGVEFAGFLVEKKEDSLYVADMQGTWVIGQADVLHVEDWIEGVPESMKSAGQPVRIMIRNEAIIYEIRPWKIDRLSTGVAVTDVNRVIGAVFSLGGAPVTDRTTLGDTQIVALEKIFSRHLGWAPDANPNELRRRSPVSKTEVVNDGYCDTDEPF